MRSKEESGEIQLRNMLKKVEDDREEFRRKIKKVEEEEDAETEQLRKEFLHTSRIREYCQPQDQKLLALLDERLDMLETMRKKKIEFASDLKEWVKKTEKDFDFREEEILEQFRKEEK